MCTKGGGDLQDGYRLFQAGTGMAIADADRFLKIGQSWKTGKTPEDYTLGLGFKVAPKNVPVEISASLSQNPSDKLLGSIVGPYKTFMNDYARNGVNAWWEDSCMGHWYGCRKWDGSRNFQGAMAQGLWEYTNDTLPPVVNFFFMPYVKFA